MTFNDALSRVSWQDFEILVANHFRGEGYDVAHCGDGHFGFREGSEVDLRMRKDGKLALVHCRHGNVSQVDAGALARLLDTAKEDEAAEVIVVSSTDIPEAARQVAEAGGAKLIDGVAVRAMLGEQLMDLHPVRGLSGADAQRGEAHLITRGNMRRSRGRRTWRSLLPAPGTKKRRALWALGIAAAALIVVVGFYAPTVWRRAHGATPAPPTQQEVLLPTPP